MKLVLSLILLLAVTVFLFSTDNKITWTVVNYPPFFILEGELKKKGVFDQAIRTVQDYLPDYEHNLIRANMERGLRNAENGEHYCISGLFKTAERENYLLFSNPFFYTISNGIIMNESDAESYEPYLNENGEINLRALLNDNAWKIGIQGGFKYGGEIDELLATSQNIVKRPADDGLLNLLKMISMGRIDGTLGYDYVLNYLKQIQSLTGIYHYYNLEESGGELYIPVYFAVPKNEWGEDVIRKINGIISRKDLLAETCHYFAENFLSPLHRETYTNGLPQESSF